MIRILIVTISLLVLPSYMKAAEQQPPSDGGLRQFYKLVETRDFNVYQEWSDTGGYGDVRIWLKAGNIEGVFWAEVGRSLYRGTWTKRGDRICWSWVDLGRPSCSGDSSIEASSASILDPNGDPIQVNRRQLWGFNASAVSSVPVNPPTSADIEKYLAYDNLAKVKKIRRFLKNKYGTFDDNVIPLDAPLLVPDDEIIGVNRDIIFVAVLVLQNKAYETIVLRARWVDGELRLFSSEERLDYKDP